ncbi:putative membrane protein [Kribbella orskensis]|uniref:Membrane protein n=1 Tax=Kribbella orskensis TaxID=2512216 RepID=A0ABY2BPK4_9ACTN|nr:MULTISPECIES: YhgE/Pip domain-containing protein [Kribbella]TCN39703.1 putative membrane protein [Kribbella sp. VKM Ac-2500]TCO27514.1 putative membrane protein [Kribbella orskensis]
MTAIRMALSELRRLTAGRLPKLAVVALLCVPMLYGGLYLYANHDPYGRLDKVPTAVVVEDEGTTLSTGEKLSVGPQVADELVKSKSFDWHRVDRAEANAGVTDGRYEFALVLPKTFSADLASSAEFAPRQANLELLTNDANNYLAHTIANQVVAQVTKTVAAQVSETAASKLLAGFSTIHGQITKAATGAGQLQSGLTSAATGVTKLQTGAGQLNTAQKQLSAGATQLSTGLTQAGKGATDLSSGASQLSTGLGTLKTKTATLPAETKKLASGADQVADGNEKIATTGQQVATASGTLVKDLSTLDGDLAARLKARGFTQAQINQVLAETAKLRGPAVTANTKIQSTSKQLNQLASGARQVSNGATALANATPALTAGINSASTGATKLSTGATQLRTGVASLQAGASKLATGEQQAVAGQGELLTGVNSLATGVGKLKTGATELNTALTNGAKRIPNPSPEARKAVAETLGAPVGLTNTSQATADSYGAGLAPFFLSLSCWIGAYVLFLLVRPLSPRALAGLQAPLRVALGGWLPPAILGAVQATLVFTAVVIVLGIDTAHPWLTVGYLMLTSLTFVAILHALSAWFGAVGKFLGLVLMVIQLVSAGGTFPWQTIPAPLYFFHHVLPMSYAIDGVRHLMYGGPGPNLGKDLLVLTAWLLAGITASALAARKQRVWPAKILQPELAL